MFRSFLRGESPYYERHVLLHDCGALESVELLSSLSEPGTSELRWAVEKGVCPTEPVKPNFGVIQPPIPVRTPDSVFRSKFPNWTITDYIHRVRNDRSVTYRRQKLLKAVRLLENSRLALARSRLPSDSRPSWYNELSTLMAKDQGPFSASTHLKNCLALTGTGDGEVLIAHPVGTKHEALLVYTIIHSEDSPPTLSHSNFLAEKHTRSPVNQVDAKFNAQCYNDTAKIVYKTDEELCMITTNSLAGDRDLTYSNLSQGCEIADFAFNPHMDSELAYLDTSGSLVLIDLENSTQSNILHHSTMAPVDLSAGLAWTDHPRLLLTYDAESVRHVDIRSNHDRMSLWSTEETIELIQTMPHDSNYATIATSRAVYLVDIRRRNATLSSRRHTLLDSPKYLACSPLLNADRDQLIFVGGRETGQVIACNFQWRNSELLIRSPRAPIRLQQPDEPILWLQSHEPTSSMPRALIHRLRAPLRGFALLPSNKEITASLMLNDVGDVFYQTCGETSTNCPYDEKILLDSWSWFIEWTRSDTESKSARTMVRNDLSKKWLDTSVETARIVNYNDQKCPIDYNDQKRPFDYDDQKRPLDHNDQKCPLCLTGFITDPSGGRRCVICNLDVSGATTLLNADADGNSGWIDPLLPILNGDRNDPESDAFSAVLERIRRDGKDRLDGTDTKG